MASHEYRQGKGILLFFVALIVNKLNFVKFSNDVLNDLYILL